MRRWRRAAAGQFGRSCLHGRAGSPAMIDNLTPYGAAATFAYDLTGTQVVALCVAARFALPGPGTPLDARLEPAGDQPPPPMADQHRGSPATSSLRVAGQGAPCRPAAEVYLDGSAQAPGGRKVAELRTRLTAGPCRKELNVIGDRYWVQTPTGVGVTAPEPFVSMPLTYERAFGGTARAADGAILAQEPRNPVGRGIYASAADAMHTPLPNIELPGERLSGWLQRATPCGYGPIGPGWQPRLALAGTYDASWAERRAPLWPEDIDPRFFTAAAPGLSLHGPLQGGETVVIEGFSPAGTIAFRLPQLNLVAKSYFGDRMERQAMRLEAVLLEPDAGAVTLFWRRIVPLGRGAAAHLHSVVREVEPWEAGFSS